LCGRWIKINARPHIEDECESKYLQASKNSFATPGPYKTIDIVERESTYQVGDMTHYGEVILILPSVLWLNDGVEQDVVVKLDPTSLSTWCEESAMERPPTSYGKIQFFPTSMATAGWCDDQPLTGPYVILASKNLDPRIALNDCGASPANSCVGALRSCDC